MQNELDLLLREAHKLKVTSITAETHFMEYLQRIEKRVDLWSKLYSTFARLLSVNKLCAYPRYAKWLRVNTLLGAKKVRSIGVSNAVTLSRVADDQMLKSVVSKIDLAKCTSRELSKAVRPHVEVRTKNTKVRSLEEEVSKEKALRVERTAKYQDTLRRLKVENTKLRAENARLLGEVQGLRERLGGASTRAAKSKRELAA